MNTFANSLFALLFGWARSLIQGIWNAAADGKLSGFFTWLGDHWMLVAAVLCLGCTAIDFLVWMIRWRPYLLWRTKWRRFRRLLRGEKVDSQRRFSQGYQEGVDLHLPDLPPVYEGPEEYGEMPESPAPVPAYAPSPLAEPLPEEFLSPTVAPAPSYDPYRPAESPAAMRRRRSDKHAPRRVSWHERLTASQDEDEGMIDGLPPAVSREEAFHEPVYPADQGVYTGWKRPHTNQTNGQQHS